MWTKYSVLIQLFTFDIAVGPIFFTYVLILANVNVICSIF